MRLGTLLLRDAVITLTQLEQALRTQVLTGGRLGTNLVELGFTDLNTLGRYLARVMDMPLAIADRFEKADSNLVEVLGPVMADRHTCLPLGYEKDDPGTIAVVMRDPLDHKSVRILENHFNLGVRTYIAAELRLFYYLERYYGIRRRTRFTRAGTEDEAPASRRERRSTQPFRGLSTPAPVSIVPRRKRETSASEGATSLPASTLSFEDACQSIDNAQDREQIARTILEYSTGRFECAALFMVRDRSAIGWLAKAPGLGIDALERLYIPLDGASVFQEAHDSARPYRGKPLTAGHPLERELWSFFALGHEPTDLSIVPICAEGRVINLVYAHSEFGPQAPPEHHEELVELSARAGRAYQRMLADSRAD